ncbi:MAG: helix-hairpin-helix domain-containing protein [Bacteroidaceae bacterium]|nr:helix-hairpin-helix domain-containing protein [Bacteroidaceae bacterium]
MRRIIVYILSTLLGGCLSAKAQNIYRENVLTWEEFISLYMPILSEDDEAVSNDETDLMIQLKQWADDPININTCNKSTLLQLPFLDEAHADSILCYRGKVGALITLGELQFISGLPYDVRQYLTLFTYAGDLPRPTPSKHSLFTEGTNEVIAHADIPFYKREGFYQYKDNGEHKANGQYYLGAPIKHNLRYKFDNNQLKYGATFDQDAGEPFAQKGNTLYDFVSAHLQWSSKDEQTTVCVGDFKISLGQGLIIGEQQFGGRMGYVDQMPKSKLKIRAHRGCNEINFFRGAAATHSWGDWKALVFASWRQLDARMENDTVRSIQTSGLHRTPTEVSRKNQLNAYIAGGALQRTFGKSHTVGINTYALSYSSPIYPKPTEYNTNYFRGNACGGASATYTWKNREWATNIELSSDHKFNPAAIAQLRFEKSSNFRLTGQIRWFSNAYIAPYAQTLSASSRTQGEQGFMLGWSIGDLWGWQHKGYIDVFRFTSTTFKSNKNAWGSEIMWQAGRKLSKNYNLTTRYKCKIKEERISGYRKQQMVGLHRFKLQLNGQHTKSTWSLMAESTCALNQVEGAFWGFIFAGRSTFKIKENLKLSGFAALFATDNYQTAVYAYEPHLPYTFNFNSFYYRGMRLSTQVEWVPFKHLSLGVKYGTTHYFNQDNISSGPQEIKGPTKSDLQLLLKARF